MRLILFGLLAAISSPAASQPANRPAPGIVRVRIVTADGSMVLALDARRAPRTTANFLAYVDDGRFDGTAFYRAARRGSAPKFGLIQGGIGTDARRILPPFPLEPTTKTGIKHLDMTVSMARRADPNSAGGNFFITVGATPTMDANGANAGYAAFGHVVAGFDTVRRILAEPSGRGADATKGQMILRPVRLISARRIDGVPKPTGRVKPWLLGIKL